MNNALSLGVMAFVAGLLGAALGAALVWRMAQRRLQAQWPTQLHEAIAPLLQRQITALIGQLLVPVAAAAPPPAPPLPPATLQRAMQDAFAPIAQ